MLCESSIRFSSMSTSESNRRAVSRRRLWVPSKERRRPPERKPRGARATVRMMSSATPEVLENAEKLLSVVSCLSKNLRRADTRRPSTIPSPSMARPLEPSLAQGLPSAGQQVSLRATTSAPATGHRPLRVDFGGGSRTSSFSITCPETIGGHAVPPMTRCQLFPSTARGATSLSDFQLIAAVIGKIRARLAESYDNFHVCFPSPSTQLSAAYQISSRYFHFSS